MTNCVPVSYTHLDVYKRQDIRRATLRVALNALVETVAEDGHGTYGVQRFALLLTPW